MKMLNKTGSEVDPCSTPEIINFKKPMYFLNVASLSAVLRV